MQRLVYRAYLIAFSILALNGAARAQAPDTILVNGKIVLYDASPAQALAVRDGKIAAIGSSPDIGTRAGPATHPRAARSRRRRRGRRCARDRPRRAAHR